MPGEEGEVPDYLRCRRTDGKRWRCRRRALQYVSFCELHHFQARRRQDKLPVPNSLKLPRGPRRRSSSTATQSNRSAQNHRKRKLEDWNRAYKVHAEGRDEKRKKITTTKTNMAELIRMVLCRNKKKKKNNNGEKDFQTLNAIPSSVVVAAAMPTKEVRRVGVKRKIEINKEEDAEGDALAAAIPTKEVRRVGVKRKIEINKEEDAEGDALADYYEDNAATGRDIVLGLETPRAASMVVKEAWMRVQKRTPRTNDDSPKGTKRNAAEPLLTLKEATISQRNDSFPMAIFSSPTTKQTSFRCSRLGVPDHLRCKRNDGKQWRCSRPAMENRYFCELHHIQQYRRQYKLGVPDELKLQRKPRLRSSIHPCVQSQIPKEIIKSLEEDQETRRTGIKEKRRKKIETLLVELIQMVLKRQMERMGMEEKRREGPIEVRRELPNGLMAISSVTSAGQNCAKGVLERKLDLDPNSFLQWCFRSKNVELTLAGTVQRVPYIRNGQGLGKQQRKICHHCRSANMFETVNCSSCQRAFFCKSCISKWYSELSAEDVREACPICRGNCCCTACLSRGSEEPNMSLNSVVVR